MCALAIMIMFVAIIPSMTYVMPAISGVIIWTVAAQINRRWAFMTYAAAAVLSLLVVPEKEAMTYFIMIFGYYPLIRDLINRATFPPVRFLVKLIFFNAMVVLAFLIVVNVFGIPVEQMLDGLDRLGGYALYGLWAMGNVVFFMYDFSLKYVYYAFENWIKPNLNKKIK